MSQNQLITILALVLLTVVLGSVAILFMTSSPSPSSTTTTDSSIAAVEGSFNLEVIQQQAYQLINKQLVREGALPVPPPVTPGKANPFL